MKTTNGGARGGPGSRAIAKESRQSTPTATAARKGAEKAAERNGRGGAARAEADGAAVRDLRERPESPGTLIDFYRQMLLIRRFEEKTGEMYTRAKIGGYCHLNLGEEATIVGVMSALEARDYIFTNYREHGYILARGVDPGRVMAELFGKETGVSRGRGGSMHLFDAKTNFLGGYAIVGGQLPLATGAGLAIAHRKEDAVVMCQMGDGTTNIGAWHESLNIAALWSLPVIFMIVNNNYGMGTTVEKASAEPDLYKKACAYRMRAERVDGNDVLAVRDAMLRAVEAGRGEKVPSVLDVASFRWRGHSVVDPDRYRSRDLVEQGRAQDPILAYAHRLQEAGLLDEAGLQSVADEVDEMVEAAVRFADESPDPEPKDLFVFDYATDVPNVDRT
ncbi:MAG: pyruvate dehydrogenase (acetyl-transferring) E1 component subunit alpha, partial [Chloroflexota bacterium]|nr:pyruvate dehydrogenase (acetyl-transferring) E1 component subunit alpha [Chloroflexota bacterium]